MQRDSVSSSTIRSIGYDSSSQTLEVEFRDGRIYHYFGVPEGVYLGLMSAPSKGQFLDANVKKAGFTYHRVG